MVQLFDKKFTKVRFNNSVWQFDNKELACTCTDEYKDLYVSVKAFLIKVKPVQRILFLFTHVLFDDCWH